MKTPSKDLFNLIHVLSKSEKRYFIIHASADGKTDKSYLNTFKLVLKQEEYREDIIRRKLKRNPSSFKRIKNYTYNSILQSLESFHKNSSYEIEIHRYFIQVELLFDKKQFLPCLNLINRILDLCYEQNQIYLIPLCMDWQFRVGVASLNTTSALRKNTIDLINTQTKNIHDLLHLKRMNSEFWNIIHTAEKVGDKEKKILKKIINTAKPILNSIKNQSYAIEKEALQLLGLSTRFYGNVEESYKYRKELVERTEKEKNKILRANDYIVALGNLMNVCTELKKDMEARRNFIKVRTFMSSIPKSKQTLRLDERYTNIYNNYVTFLRTRGHYKEVLSYGKELELRFKKHGYFFHNSLIAIFYESMSYSAFYIKDYKLSSRYYQLMIRNSDKSEYHKKLFGLILFFERGDYDGLHYLSRSIQYQLKKDKQESGYESIINKTFLNYLSKGLDKEELRDTLIQLEKELIPFHKPLETLARMRGFRFLDWIRSKF